ncbi:MAG: PAS domain-containing protein [Aestuariivirgaceae bacterium]|nr:PAS domain-containing protein [Aestuariivirgaceae bacterium]
MAFHGPRAGEDSSSNLHPGNRSLFCYWESVRGEAAAPLRLKIDLKRISDILPGVIIMERAAEAQSYRCRLSGTGVGELWGADMTGRDLRDVAGNFEREVLARLFDGVFAGLQPFSARLRLFPAGEEPVMVEMLGLPVIAQSGETQLLGAVLPMATRRRNRSVGWRNLQIAATRTIATEHRHLGGRGENEGVRARFRVIEGGLNL